MKNKGIVVTLAVVALLLLIPLIAMQFTNEVQWTLSDFVLMGILLTGTGLLLNLAIRKIRATTTRFLVGGAILLTFLLIWAELAVGIFGSPFAGS